MCGIITVFETRGEENQLRPEVLKMSKKNSSPRSRLVGNILR